MKLLSLLLAGSATLLLAGAAQAQCIDQNAPTNNACMAGFGQVDLAQSFKPSASNCTGAGIYMYAGVGSPETLSIGLWTALPNAGGTLLASGSGTASPGAWFDVSWASVPVTPGTTYYLVFSTTFSMCYAGDIANGYPNGQVYANAGFGSFPSYDYTFRTYSSCGGGFTLTKAGACPGPMTVSTTGGTPNTNVAYVYGNAGVKTKPGGVCAGTTVQIANPKLLAISAGNGAGASSYSFNASGALCGKTVQAVLIGPGPCTTSNTITL